MDERHAADALVKGIMSQRAGVGPLPSQAVDNRDMALAEALQRLSSATRLDTRFAVQLEARLLHAPAPASVHDSANLPGKQRWPPLAVARAPLLAVLVTLLLAVASFAVFRAAGSWPLATAQTPSALPSATPAGKSSDGQAAAINNIRTCLAKPDALVRYLSTARSSYASDIMADFYRAGSYDVQVNSDTGTVIQIGPRAGASIPDTGLRLTPEQLQALALDFIARCAGAELGTLVANHGSKGDNVFFRWEDRTRTIEGMYPFVQVGFNSSGQLLSYTHTLDLSRAATATRQPMPIFTPSAVVQQLVLVPGQPQQLIALVSNFRLARSMDGGTTWNELLTPELATMLYGIGIDAHDPQRLYAAGGSGIFRSNDQGRHWFRVHWMGGQGITVDYDDPQVLWTVNAIGRTAIILRSSDSGRTWVDASAGIAGAMLAGPLLIDPGDPNSMFAVFSSERGGHMVYRGTRSGDWTRLPLIGSAGACCAAQVGLAWSSHSQTLYVGSLDGKLYATASAKEPNVGRTTWNVVADFGPQINVNVLAYDDQSDTLYISTYDAETFASKLLISLDGGATTRALNLP